MVSHTVRWQEESKVGSEMQGHGTAVFIRGARNNVTGKGTLEEGPERATSLAVRWLRILLVIQGTWV